MNVLQKQGVRTRVPGSGDPSSANSEVEGLKEAEPPPGGQAGREVTVLVRLLRPPRTRGFKDYLKQAEPSRSKVLGLGDGRGAEPPLAGDGALRAVRLF